MLVLNIKSFLQNKLTLIIFSLISILVILSIIIYTLAMRTNILRGTIVEDIIGKIGQKDSIFNMHSYYSEFEITVVGNKNTNTYKMKEWYEKDIGTKQEYLDSEGSKVDIVTIKDKTVIQNEKQKNVLKMDPYITSYTNLLSINTFLDIYNKSNEKSGCFTASSYEKVNNINMLIDNNCKNIAECKCEYMNIVKNVSKVELKLDKNTGLPLTYIVYDNDKKECISIVYNKFDINQDIESKIFDI